jgi:signal transduction histidine kinase
MGREQPEVHRIESKKRGFMQSVQHPVRRDGLAPLAATRHLRTQLPHSIHAVQSALNPLAGILTTHPILLTLLAAVGAIAGLAIAALLTRDPREAGAYAVACVMIGGAMAAGDRAAGPRTARTSSTVRTNDDSISIARREVREVAHDLRAPLLTVSSYLDLIAQGAFGDISDEAQAALRQCASVTGRAQTVVETTLQRDASNQADAGDSLMHPVSLNSVVSDVIDALTASMRECGATVAVEGRLPIVMGDETALFRVFSNLVENSIKYTAPGVTPRISIHSERLFGGDVAIFVRDNGRGIRSDEVTSVTATGVRGSSAQTDGRTGMGLGLATVARLTTRMGGTFMIESTSDGGTGAVVRVTLRSR